MDIKEIYSLVQLLTKKANLQSFASFINQLRSTLNQLKNFKAALPQTVQTNQQIQNSKTTIDRIRLQAISALNEILPAIDDYEIQRAIKRAKLEVPFNTEILAFLNRIPNELDSNLEELNEYLNKYNQRVTAFQQFTSAIDGVLGDISPEAFLEEDELIVIFEGDASVNNLKELSRVSNEWNQIVNCFGRLVKENNTEIKIISIQRGSLIEVLAISSLIISGIIAASNKILNLILKIYDVKKKALELKNMQLDSIAKAIEILELQATVKLTDEAKTIVNELMKEYGWKIEDENYNETETATIKGVKKLIKFHSSGGKVDARLLETSNDQAESIQSIKQKNTELVKAETELKQLSGEERILKIEDEDVKDEDE